MWIVSIALRPDSYKGAGVCNTLLISALDEDVSSPRSSRFHSQSIYFWDRVLDRCRKELMCHKTSVWMLCHCWAWLSCSGSSDIDSRLTDSRSIVLQTNECLRDRYTNITQICGCAPCEIPPSVFTWLGLCSRVCFCSSAQMVPLRLI
jgi:hypothetical protein